MDKIPNDGDIPPDCRAERIPNPEATSLKGVKADDLYPDDWPPELVKRALETPEDKPAEANYGGNQIRHQATVGADPCLWAERISSAWRKSAEAFIETGRLLNEAKEQLSHGEWLPMVRELPFSERTAQMLMRIARDKRIANPQNISYLPPSWSVLHELTKLDDQTFSAMLREGSINPSMTKLVADNAAWIEKHRKGVLLKKVRRASPPKKPAKPTPQAAPTRPRPLPPTAANDLLETAVRLSADLEAWPANCLATVRLMPIDDRRKLGELSDKIVNWWLRVHDAATPKKELEI